MNPPADLTCEPFEGRPLRFGWSLAGKRHRAEPAHRLRLAGLHPRKRVVDIPEQWARTCFDLLPIHEKLRTRDF